MKKILTSCVVVLVVVFVGRFYASVAVDFDLGEGRPLDEVVVLAPAEIVSTHSFG